MNFIYWFIIPFMCAQADSASDSFWIPFRQSMEKKDYAVCLDLLKTPPEQGLFTDPALIAYLEGTCRQELEDWEKASLAFDKAKEMKELRPDALYDLGLSLSNLHREDEAMAAFKEAAELTPPGKLRCGCLVSLGTLAMQQKQEEILQWTAALLSEETNLSEDVPPLLLAAYRQRMAEPSSSRLLSCLIRRYPKEEDSRLAIMASDPHALDLDLALSCVDVLLRQGHPKDSLAFLDVVRPRLPEAQLGAWTVLQARAFKLQDRLSDACASLKDYLSHAAAPHPAAALLYADDLKRLGRREEAEKAYRDCPRIIPGTPEAWEAQWRRVLLLEEMGEGAEARQSLSEVADSAPTEISSKALWKLGTDLVREKNVEKARQALQSLVQLDAHDERTGLASLFLAKLDQAQASTWVQKTLDLSGYGSYPYHRALDMAGASLSGQRFIELSIHPSQIAGMASQPGAVADGLTDVSQLDLSSFPFQPAFFLSGGLYERAEWALKALPSQNSSLAEARALACVKQDQFLQAIHWAEEARSLGYGDGLLPFMYPTHYRDLVMETAKRYDVDPRLVWAMIREESRFMKEAHSPAGAVGLMQIMPSTGRWVWQKKGEQRKSSDLLKPDVNIETGIWYLDHLLEFFDGNVLLAIAGYNAGPGRPRDWCKSTSTSDVDLFIEDIPFMETRHYVRRVLGSYAAYCSLFP